MERNQKRQEPLALFLEMPEKVQYTESRIALQHGFIPASQRRSHSISRPSHHTRLLAEQNPSHNPPSQHHTPHNYKPDPHNNNQTRLYVPLRSRLFRLRHAQQVQSR